MRGFGVVSQEVRNLALNSAQAARNTGALIEDTVEKIKVGAGLMQETSAHVDRLATSNVKVKELVGEIAAASHEQARDVDQISRSWREIQEVVQQHAEKTHESAITSQTMDEHARRMKAMVDKLAALITG